MDSNPAELSGSGAQAGPAKTRSVSYDEVTRGIDVLCQQIASSPDGWRPDAVVAVVRGGLVPATHICHYFDCPIYFINRNALLGELAGRRILVVDEINDTGQSFRRIRDDIFGQAPNDSLDVRFAVLYTRYNTAFRADYFLDFEPYFLKDGTWQNFPWERA